MEEEAKGGQDKKKSKIKRPSSDDGLTVETAEVRKQGALTIWGFGDGDRGCSQIP